MGSFLRLGIAAGFGLVLGAGCLSTDGAFECAETEQCVMHGTQGVCQANAWCSFPDTLCPSGQRYAEMAEVGVAGYCVPMQIAVDPGDDGTDETGETGN